MNVGQSGKVKLCRRCDETKPHEEFGQSLTAKDGRQSWCKPCMREYHRNYDKKVRPLKKPPVTSQP